MSAFAARRANQTLTTRIAPPTTNIEQPVIEARDELEASTVPRKKRRHGERPKSVGIQQPAIEATRPSATIQEQESSVPNEADASEYESEEENH